MEEFLCLLEKHLSNLNSKNEELNKYLKAFLCSNGKRVRSRLAYLSIRANEENITNQQIELIAAGELLHAASLIHDDIIDDAESRRGLKTLSRIYDSKLAVIVGDFLASVALNKISSLNNFQIQTEFLNTFSRMCTAEISQYFSKGQYSTIQEYLLKTEQKTAALFSAILRSVAILSQNVDIDKMSSLGYYFGLGFQIRNDLNDFLTESPNDEFNGIYTAPNIFINQGFSRSEAIEKTNDLIDNMKQEIFYILQSLQKNIYVDEIKYMVERL